MDNKCRFCGQTFNKDYELKCPTCSKQNDNKGADTMVKKMPTTLDHLKDYIHLTQQAKVELANGNRTRHDELFIAAEAHLKEASWESLILNGE